MITLHTRLRNLSAEQEAALAGYADQFNLVARHLAADMAREKRKAASFKNDYLRRFPITARQFNAVRSYVEGLAENRAENLKHQENVLSEKILVTQKLLPKIARQIATARAQKVVDRQRLNRLENRLHQKTRKLRTLMERQSQVIEERQRPFGSGICFGGRKLFNKQYHLAENGYRNHAEWLRDWRFARSSQFFVLGSKDETAGCQGCVARTQEDGSFLLDLRLPGEGGERITVGPLSFAYGSEKLRAAILAHSTSKANLPRITKYSKSGKPYSRIVYPDNLTALSWRFQRDERGWRVFVSFQEALVPVVTDEKLGVLAVDVNADHLAWAELDRFGNPVATGSIPCVTYGKTAEQAEAVIEAAAIVLSSRAKQTGKSLVLENLDFSKKKRQLTEVDGARYARMLSSLSYSKIHHAIRVRAAKDGVDVKTVNPAYTSVLGRLHWADRYGVTVHEGAAVAIGRRVLRLREVPAHRVVQGERIFLAPDGRNGHVTLVAPVRKRSRHVWSYLSQVNRKLKAALAAQHEARKLDPSGHAVSDARKISNAPVVAAA